MPDHPPLWQQLAMRPILSALALGGRLGMASTLVGAISRQMQRPWLKRRAFAGYQPTAHDVFVCTYAKSGTNWAMQIAQQIACYGAAESAHIHDLVAWPDAQLPLSIVDLRDPRPRRQAPTGLRVIKTHLESRHVPYQPAAKYLVVSASAP